MRKILLVLMASLVGMSGCWLGEEDFDTTKKPTISVFLEPASTQAFVPGRCEEDARRCDLMRHDRGVQEDAYPAAGSR
jgi:hypothetical protein